MCGINGIFAYHSASSPLDRGELLRTRDHMAARGPDGKGVWVAEGERVGFGHRRLSIVDLSDRASQPMASVDGKIVVTFNGEIYNHRELRRELEAAGRIFRTTSDTEVLLHLYAEKGHAMVHDLRGMFAFGIWDSERSLLLLARDPYGIKPLYFSDDGKTIRFASQVKSLLEGGAISKDIDPAGCVGFHLFGCVPEPFTIYRAIRSLPAGSFLRVDRRGPQKPESYHSIAAVYCDSEVLHTAGSDEERQATIRTALLDSVRHHLVADVPVGAFLSAGIDSGALVGLMRDSGQSDIQTVTLVFEEFQGWPDDEGPLAAKVAQTYGTRHNMRLVRKGEFLADLPSILAAMDQPTIDGVNSWFVAKAAHELGLKVAISGVGGDELFGGYPSFRDIPTWVRWLKLPASIPLLGRTMRKVAVTFGAARLGISTKAFGLLEYGGNYAGAWLIRRGLFMPWELNQMLDPEFVSEGLERLQPMQLIENVLRPEPHSSYAKIATMESALYMRNQLLRDTDWASMAHSLEVRTPLVDATLLRRVAETGWLGDTSQPKRSLAAAPSTPLPPAVIARKKTGFGVPVAPWMPSNNGTTSRSVYSYSRSWARQVFGPTAVVGGG